MSRIVFLDVDGPLIPGRMYFRRGATYDVAYDVSIYCPSIVDMINYLTDATGALIVFNSTHNEQGADGMRRQAEYNRLRNLHDDVVTGFPYQEMDCGPDGRNKAIDTWLRAHKAVEHFCIFDDEALDTANFYQVDFDVGVTTSHIAWALEHLTGFKGEGLGFAPGGSSVTDGLNRYRRLRRFERSEEDAPAPKGSMS